MTSIGLRPALLFFSLTGVNTAASISARKLSNGTTRAIISRGSPFAVIDASRLSASKNPNCPIVPTRESCCHNSDSHKSAEVAIFRGAHEAATLPMRHQRRQRGKDRIHVAADEIGHRPGG